MGIYTGLNSMCFHAFLIKDPQEEAVGIRWSFLSFLASELMLNL